MPIRITCIKKDAGNHENPYVAISSLNWKNEVDETTGTATREAMYDWILGGGYGYVRDTNNNVEN